MTKAMEKKDTNLISFSANQSEKRNCFSRFDSREAVFFLVHLKSYFDAFYFTGKYPTPVTTFCPSGLRIQSIYFFRSPVGLFRIYI